MKQYLELLKDIKDNGINKNDRTGTGTRSLFGRMMSFNLNDGFPIVTTKYVPFRLVVTELLWFLKGDTNIKYLVENNCHIWDGDCYSNYSKTIISDITFNDRCKNFKSDGLEFNSGYPNYIHYSKDEFIEKIKTDIDFSKKWGELGNIYGKQWRHWNTNKEVSIKDGTYPNGEFKYKFEYKGIDQIKNLINDLNNNPDSRRLMVSAWNVQDIPNMVLPPCHYGFQCYTDLIKPIDRYNLFNKYVIEHSLDITGMSTDDAMVHYNFPTRKLSLMYNARSQDAPLGTPFNISSYALLLVLISKQVNMLPYELKTVMGDCHIYLNQMEGVDEQLKREPLHLPSIIIKNKKVNDISEYEIDDIQLINYKSYNTIKYPLSN